MSTEYIIRNDGVAVLTVKNPPVNALSNHVLNSLITHVELLDKNPSVKAVVPIEVKLLEKSGLPGSGKKAAASSSTPA